MATFIALLLALGVYTGTIAGINQYFAKVPAGSLNFEIYEALLHLSGEAIKLGIPEPFHLGVAGVALILPSILSFAIVRFIVR